jgi:hypothetical protein
MRLNATQLGFFLDKNIIQYTPNLKFMVNFFFFRRYISNTWNFFYIWKFFTLNGLVYTKIIYRKRRNK